MRHKINPLPSPPSSPYPAHLVHLLLPVIDELHALLQAAQFLQAALMCVLLPETQKHLDLCVHIDCGFKV